MRDVAVFLAAIDSLLDDADAQADAARIVELERMRGRLADPPGRLLAQD